MRNGQFQVTMELPHGKGIFGTAFTPLMLNTGLLFEEFFSRVTSLLVAAFAFLTFYFSLITVSTVGYGEIVPYSNEVKAVAAVEIVCRVLLLLFGSHELINYTRGRLLRVDE